MRLAPGWQPRSGRRPTGAFVAILAGVTAHYGISGLETATLMAGIILVLMGAAKMGSVIRFIPAPVIIGFTAGIAVTIFVGQWRDFLGLPPVQAEHFHERLWRLIEAMPHLNWPTAALGLGSLLLVIYTPRVPALSRLPGPLVAMLVATVAQAIFHFPGVATLANIMTPLFGGFAATGAIARTATNIRNGATGPLAGLVHAATLIAVLLILTPLAASIPLAALAAILFVVSWNMSDVGRFRSVMRARNNGQCRLNVLTFVAMVICFSRS